MYLLSSRISPISYDLIGANVDIAVLLKHSVAATKSEKGEWNKWMDYFSGRMKIEEKNKDSSKRIGEREAIKQNTISADRKNHK